MKILFFFFLMMLSTKLASAYDVYINGVYYNIDYIAKTAEVTFLNKDAYSGSVNIPATLTNVNITTKASMEFTDQGFDNAQEISIITLSDCTTLTFNAGTNKNAPKYYYSGTSIRMYPGNFLTVTAASGKTLASIVITYSVNNAEGQISASSGTVAVNNMAVTISAINATTTTITNSHTGLGASSQLRLVSITITYMEDCDAATYNVTSIGNSAFYGCSNLTSVTIPNSVTSIGDRAFYGCCGLPSVTIPNSVTSIGDSVFSDCSGLTAVTIPNGVTTIGNYAFYNCSGLTAVTIPNSVTSIGNSAFASCSGLTAVTIPNSVTSIGEGAFSSCNGLTAVTIPNSVTSIGKGAFSSCSGLTTVTIPNSVTSIGNNAFQGCRGLTAVTIPNSVTNIGDYAFSGTKLKTFIVGTGLLTIGNNAFDSNIRPIKTIWLTNTPPTNYTIAQGTVNYVANSQYGSLNNIKEYKFLSSMFDVDGVKYVPVSPSDRTCDAIDCVYDEAMTEVNINATVTYKGINMKVLNVQSYAFYENSNLQKASFDINGSLSKYVFYGCTNLKSAVLGDSITGIDEYAFSGCSMLEDIIVPDSVKSIGQYAFSGCSGITSVIIGNGTETIGQYAFSGCSNLPIITIPGSVTRINNYTFSGCKSLKEVIMADREDDGNLTLGSNGNSPLFADCPLDSVYIGRNIAYQKGSNYGYSPFYRNTSLRSVVITDKEEEISENEFYGCTSLQNVEIGDGVTEIGNRAFSGCASLRHFGFGTQVKSIGAEAFSDCTALTAIISKAEMPPVCASQALDDVNKWECTLTVPVGCVDAYQSADQWKEFFFVEEGDENGSTPIDPSGKKCATPTIAFVDGKLTFTCETEGVEYAFEVTNADVKKGHASEVDIEGTYKVSVYAMKAGYVDSDVATMEFTLGAGGGNCDVNGDGHVDVADIAAIIDKMASRARMQEETP